ncbi:hypothetical protein MCOR27_000914 [Pyricularia oryzae]|uniref:Fungal N-terminal domain-containing protein n=2 Tax=Pyricularia TaxID=48558 RepID=A0ABQ8NU66_PYRGI|nr:hypothetical protein MCOR27_000914 [Pyricularia oryzae]KAI6302184.1 hypothetical protein MCOR33_002499 [Pyricularia grisea]KAI6320374.1 hypothetical protein MCOR34_002940 [Pyricularia oryzae]KAI6353565.1 hypothetical protein MCOR32_010839 [Pyricularia oryzae]KAI6563237.1 hypothetical protein MCOR03_003024 [Pyricularia oryzae]
MEALAAGASIIGVISLAIQLVELSTKFLSFYDSVSNAAKELCYLKGLVVQVRFVAVGVQNIFGEYQRAHDGGGRVMSLVPGIHVALQDCFAIVTEIQNVVDKAGTRLWSKVELALKQQAIARCEQRLGLALQFFHTNLSMASMFYEASERSRFTPLITKQESFTALFGNSSITTLADTRPPASLDKTNAADAQIRMQRSSTVVTKTTGAGSHIFGAWESRQITTTEKTQIGSSYAQTRNVENVYSVIPHFLHWSIHVTRQSGSSLFYGLQVTPVRLREEIYDIIDDLFEELCETPCSQDEEIQKINMRLRSENLALDHVVQDRDGGYSYSLGDFLEFYLHDNATSLNPLKGLVLYTVSKATCIERPWFLFASLYPDGYSNYLAKLDLDEFEKACHLTPRYFARGGIGDKALDTIQQLLAQYVQTPFLAWPTFCHDIIVYYAKWWHFSSHVAKRRLETAIALVKVLKSTKHEEALQSSLDWISCCTFAESRIALLNEWVQVLHQERVPISTVLSEDWPMVIDRFQDQFGDYSAARLYTVHNAGGASGGTEFTQTPWYQPDSPIAELTEQFHFCADVEICYGSWCEGVFYRRLASSSAVGNSGRCIPDLYRASAALETGQPSDDDIEYGTMEELFLRKYAWLDNLCRCNLEGDYVDLWPFCGRTHTMCRSGNLIEDAKCLGAQGGPRWCQYHRCKFNHERFARKQARRNDRRLGWPEKKLRRRRVPGAWVE